MRNDLVHTSWTYERYPRMKPQNETTDLCGVFFKRSLLEVGFGVRASAVVTIVMPYRELERL